MLRKCCEQPYGQSPSISSCSGTCDLVSFEKTICTILPITIFVVACKFVLTDSDGRKKERNAIAIRSPKNAIGRCFHQLSCWSMTGFHAEPLQRNCGIRKTADARHGKQNPVRPWWQHFCWISLLWRTPGAMGADVIAMAIDCPDDGPKKLPTISISGVDMESSETRGRKPTSGCKAGQNRRWCISAVENKWNRKRWLPKKSRAFHLYRGRFGLDILGLDKEPPTKYWNQEKRNIVNRCKAKNLNKNRTEGGTSSTDCVP